MKRINISIADGLLEMVDKVAAEDFTTRSDIIRAALLWYLRPQGRELAHTDPKEILKTLKRRQTHAAMKQHFKKVEGKGV
mgnify:CR=1 FL=1